MNFFSAKVDGGRVKLPFADLARPQGARADGDVIAGHPPRGLRGRQVRARNLANGVEFEAPVELVGVDGLGDLRLLPYEGGEVQLRRARRAGQADSGTAEAGRQRRRQPRGRPPEPGVRRGREGQSAWLWVDADEGPPVRPRGRHNLDHAARRRGRPPERSSAQRPCATRSIASVAHVWVRIEPVAVALTAQVGVGLGLARGPIRSASRSISTTGAYSSSNQRRATVGAIDELVGHIA